MSMADTSLGGANYIPVSIATLSPLKSCGVALYTVGNGSRPSLFRGAEYPIMETDIQRLIAEGRRKLFVLQSEHERFQSYLREVLDDALLDESLSIGRRFGMLNEVARDTLANCFCKGDVSSTVAECEHLAHQMVETICRHDALTAEICGVLYHDYHTFTHSTNVSCYCVMLAKALGTLAEEQLREIAVGGLLHDLGKLDIPDKILTKPGRLTDEEFAAIKRHPVTGFTKLCRREDLNYGQLMMAYQHHERLDGGGYPVGVGGPEIHPWARICAIVDVYEALTSNRPYRARMTAEDAFQIMDRGLGGFDKEMYRCWKILIRGNSN